MAIFQNKLYVGDDNNTLHVSADGEEFTPVESYKGSRPISMTVFQNKLYVGDNDKTIHVSSDGKKFTTVKGYKGSYPYSLAVFQDKLYVGDYDNTLRVSSDGKEFKEVKIYKQYIWSMMSYEPEPSLKEGLYIALEDKIETLDGTKLDYPGYDPISMTVFQNKLYVGDYNKTIHVSSDGKEFTKVKGYKGSSYPAMVKNSFQLMIMKVLVHFPW